MRKSTLKNALAFGLAMVMTIGTGALVAHAVDDGLEITVQNASEPNTIDPNEVNANDCMALVLHLYEGLTRYRQDLAGVELAQAESVDAVITIQSRISEIEYQLDNFNSQLRLYDNQVDYATVNLNLSEVKTYSPTPQEKESVVSRMIRGLQDTLDGLAEFFEDLLVGLVSLLPVIALLAVFVGIVMAVVRRLLRRRREKKEKRKAEEEKARQAEENAQ